ncbi:hypothetical protein C8R47DRAFT_1217816 [Mycena vitilis]|nr:hypothetical protein C8R47DRAFT_1217816 [Mycena vitilis]
MESCGKQAELSTLGDEIFRLECTLQTLRNEHFELTAEMAQYSCILSPIWCLPLEIVGEIFLHFAPSMFPAPDLSPVEEYSTFTPSIVLAPGPDDDEKAFTALPLQSKTRDSWYRTLEDAEGYDIETSLDYIQECLLRSRDYPLSLRLWMDSDTHDIHPLLDILLPHSARTGGLQGLQRITFTHLTEAAPALNCAPDLTDLTFLDTQLPVTDHHNLPLSRITRYREFDCWRWGAEARFASYRLLTNVLVFVRDAAFLFATGDPRITFLEMPALENLSVECSGSLPFELRACIPSSSPCLKVLLVRAQHHYMPVARGDLERAFEIFPDLTEISIEVPNVVFNADFARLIPYNDLLPLAPKLEIIRLSNKSFIPNDCGWRTLLSMLQAQFKPAVGDISRLRQFGFSTDDRYKDENVIAGLETLRRLNCWDITSASSLPGMS